MLRVNVVFHSVSGGTFRMAEVIAAGVVDIPTCKGKFLRIPEPGGAEPINMPGLRQICQRFSHLPEATVQDLADCDGLAIVAPYYWGSMSYATKHFLDSAAKLWDSTTHSIGLGLPNCLSGDRRALQRSRWPTSWPDWPGGDEVPQF